MAFENLQATHQTLCDDYVELDQLKDEFKTKSNEMRIKVWKNVEEIAKLKRELTEKTKGNELPTEKKESAKTSKQTQQNRKKFANNNKKRWNKQKKEN